MATKKPMLGLGQFQWNTGGWFGGQLGCTAWLLPTGLILLYQIPMVGIIWIVIFVAINALGFWMWKNRDRLDPYRAIQTLMLACGVSGLLAVFCLDLLQPGMGLFDISFQNGRFLPEHSDRLSLHQAYLFFLLGVPAMMGWFALLERGARKARLYQGASHVTSVDQPRITR